MLDEGILLVYCGWGEDRTYRPGWVLLSKEEPERVLARSEEPILEPAKNWGERFGLTNHVVAESLLRHEGRCWLYYGAADKAVCLAFGRRATSKIGAKIGDANGTDDCCPRPV